ncbi:MAG: hypothetical protein AAFP76_05630 [Bacteroidota bacterium]
MKRILLVACALLIGSYTAQAQDDREVAAQNGNKKVVVQKDAPVVEKMNTEKSADEMGVNQSNEASEETKKLLKEREERMAAIRAEKRKEKRANYKGKKTGKKTSKARVLTEEQKKAEMEEKRKKAIKN